jgi:hypothetical protein
MATPDNRQFDQYLRLLQRGGYMVEALAKAKYPDAVQLDYGGDFGEDFARTMGLLERQSVTLFEATLLFGRRLARVDILEKKDNKFRLIEVKSSKFDGAKHAADLAAGKAGAFRVERKPHGIRKDWLDYFEDIAFQQLLLERILPDAVVEPWLVLLDDSKQAEVDDIPSLFELVTTGDRLHTARYIGSRAQYDHLNLVTEVCVAEEIALIRDEIEAAANELSGRLDASLSDYLIGLERGTKCAGCEFRNEDAAGTDGFSECWGDLAKPTPHALELYSIGKVSAADGRPMVQSLFEAGTTSLFEVPVERLITAKGEIGPQALRQRRQIDYTRRNEVFLHQDLGNAIARLTGPLFFIDFEAARLALPYHAKMKPYGLLAFQWSAHSVVQSGEDPLHSEWLNVDDAWPNQTFAETLRAAIGDDGPVLTWSSFEKTTLEKIAPEVSVFGREAPELVEWLNDVARRRVVDMYKWCNDWYYHPGMRGRSSIKVVLDAIWRTSGTMREEFTRYTRIPADAAIDPYQSLPPIEIAGVLQSVREGTGAVLAYEEMMYGASRRDATRRQYWAQLLKQYCSLDTLSMVLIFEYWRRQSTSN